MTSTWLKANCRECAGGMFLYSRAPLHVGCPPCYQDCVMPSMKRATDKDVVECSLCGNRLPCIQDVEAVTDAGLIAELDAAIAAP